MKLVLLASLVVLALACGKSDCEKAAEKLCSNASSEGYDLCYGGMLMRCAKKSE